MVKFRGKFHVPFWLPLQNTLLFRLGITSDPNRDHEYEYHDNAKFPELVTAEQADNGKACEGQETETIPNDVSCLSHPAMPGISRAKLFRRGDVE